MSIIRKVRRPQGRAETPHNASSRQSDSLFDHQVHLGAREIRLGEAVTRRFLSDPDVESVEVFPDTFEWFDGLDGRDHMHVPLLLVSRRDGTRTFVDVRLKRRLEKDPEFAGQRSRILLECLARGAAHEIWTEAEIRAPRTSVSALSVADGPLRTGYVKRTDPTPDDCHPPGILKQIAMRLGVWDLRCIEGVWIGRAKSTGNRGCRAPVRVLT